MALIQCPYCGKKISSTVSICIHCGKSLLPHKENALREYTKLGKEEKAKLEDEFFYKLHPQYGKVFKRIATVTSLRDGFWLAASLPAFVMAILRIILIFNPTEINIADSIPFMVGLTVLFLMLAMALIIIPTCCLVLFKRNNKMLIAVKRYEEWLKTQKNILFVPKFESDRHSKYYKQIQLNYERF